MSLKDFVSEPDVSARLRTAFPTPAIPTKPPLRAPPLTKNYSLVGTAFDYLLRFYIERLNPCSKANKWIAEEAAFGEVGIRDEVISLEEVVEKARKHYRNYLASGAVTDDLLASILALAQLDPLRRRPELLWDNSYFEKLGQIDPLDIADLRQLLALVRPEHFCAKNTCLLNPTFGTASDLVSGADCDLIIENTIVEIKTTKQLAIQREYLNQLLGYFLLAKIGAIDGALPDHTINSIAIYYSRFGFLWTFDLSKMMNASAVLDLAGWFEKRAHQS